jgi:hypothetical protein
MQAAAGQGSFSIHQRRRGMRVTESKDQIIGVNAKFLAQATFKISKRLERLPPAKVCFHQKQGLST